MDTTTFEVRSRRNRGRWTKWVPWPEAKYAKGITSLLVDAEWDTVTLENTWKFDESGDSGVPDSVLGVQYRKTPKDVS